MDVKDYRKSYEDQLAAAAAQRNETAAKPAWPVPKRAAA